MKRPAEVIVKNYKEMIGIYLVLVLLSLVGMGFVSIEYDLSTYLPKEMNSIQGKERLDQEFNIRGTASLMIKSKDLHYIQEVKSNINALPQVNRVLWLDDVEDIRKPREFFDPQITKQFLQGEYSLLEIQFKEGNDTLNTKEAIDEINKMIEADYYIGGPAAISKTMQDTTNREMVYYTLVAFIIITMILLLSSRAYHEPILFFITIGVAILMNMGTNLIFGSISSNTYAVSNILQLAVSMDYSIFLLHRYHEENHIRDKKQAMTIAIEKTFSATSASALTTVCGFLALVFMKYEIGQDMGLVLAKGVLLSLISVITLMPCLILLVDEKMSKYQHPILLPDFKKSAHWLVKFKHIALFIAIILVIPAYLGQSKVQYYYSTGKTLSAQSPGIVANEKIQEVFGHRNELVVVIPKGDPVQIQALINEIKAVEAVESVEGLYSMVDPYLPDLMIPQEVRENFESQNYTYFIVNILAEEESLQTTATIEAIHDIVDHYDGEGYITGESAIYLDLQQVTAKDFNRVNRISILLITLVLLITFKSLLIPGLLVFVIQLGIWINLSIPYFQGISLNFISFIIIGAIQLGATVDYAILFTSRYRENLGGLPPLEAMKKTIGDTGRAILTSGLILMAGTLSVSFITTIRSASELTLLIGRGALISLILVFTLLPALLLIFHPIIKYTTLGWPQTSDLKGE